MFLFFFLPAPAYCYPDTFSHRQVGPQTCWAPVPAGQSWPRARADRCPARGAFKYGGNEKHWLQSSKRWSVETGWREAVGSRRAAPAGCSAGAANETEADAAVSILSVVLVPLAGWFVLLVTSSSRYVSCRGAGAWRSKTLFVVVALAPGSVLPPAVLVRQQPSFGVEHTRVHGARFSCALRPGPRCALGPPGPYTATLLHLSCDLTAPDLACALLKISRDLFWHVLCWHSTKNACSFGPLGLGNPSLFTKNFVTDNISFSSPFLVEINLHPYLNYN